MFSYNFFLCIVLAVVLLLSNAIFRMSLLRMLQKHQEEALLGKRQLNNPSQHMKKFAKVWMLTLCTSVAGSN